MFLIAIENIKAGDKVISTNSDTFETAQKTVLETYIRKVNKLVYLTIAGALIITTVDHPFYVRNQDFVSASELQVGYETINSNGEVLLVEDIKIEFADKPVTVYNFQVEDFHTYYVGNICVLVHNAEYLPTQKSKGFIKRVDNQDGSVTITKNIKGKSVDVTYTKGADGSLYPRFEQYAHPEYSNPQPVKGMNGDYTHDSYLANKAANITGGTPKGYTWHHLEDAKSMILIQSDVHSVAKGGFSHIGGASTIRNNGG